MAARAQQIGPSGFAGFGVALLLAALSLGTLAVVGLNAEGLFSLGPADWAALRFTVSQAVVSAILSVGLAIPLARALARRRFVGRRLLVLLLGAPFILPVVVAILGLLAVYGRSGILSDVLVGIGYRPLEIYGFDGVVLAHVFFNLPLVTRLLLQGWQAVPAEQFRLAAQLGIDGHNFTRHLEWPILRAVLPGAFVTVFLLCVTSFAVALTLGGGPRATTLELAIYQAFRFDFDLGRAALLAVMQFALCAVAAVLAWKTGRTSEFSPGIERLAERWDGRSWFASIGDGIMIVMVALFLLVPTVMVIVNGLHGLATLPASIIPAAMRSILVALGSALLTLWLAVMLALAIARQEPQNPRVSGLLEGVGYLSIAASPMVIGTGLFLLLFPHIDPARLALPITALVNAAMSLPFALRALLPAVRQARQDYGALADSLGMTGLSGFRLAIWPRIRPAAGFATGLAAALSMGDLGVIALFADADGPTLPLLMYRLMGAYQMQAAAGAGLLLLVLSLGLFWVFDREGRHDAGA
ncbi:MAG: thiamine/thiamine pyrophosphate ABC transporter permease ThiP [Rhodobacteraceae bacterium]|nr:thiamine/thiamine pyrophosphate ABC transporter permease ThiP [Paracoccaceae bacterium]